MKDQDIKTIDDIKSVVTGLLDNPDAFLELEKDKDLFVILVNGKRIKTTSGKVVWNSIGAAKNALRHHISDLYHQRKFHMHDYKVYNDDGTIQYHEMAQAMTDTENEWISKHVVFMPFDKYMAVRRKRK